VTVKGDRTSIPSRLLAAAVVLLALGFLGLACGAVGGSSTTAVVHPSSADSTALSESPHVGSVVLVGHVGWTTALAWSPDGTMLASSSGDYQTHDNT
jgi:WD40 repeat protein